MKVSVPLASDLDCNEARSGPNTSLDKQSSCSLLAASEEFSTVFLQEHFAITATIPGRETNPLGLRNVPLQEYCDIVSGSNGEQGGDS
jgi:hypothetical protein